MNLTAEEMNADFERESQAPKSAVKAGKSAEKGDFRLGGKA